MPAYQYEPLLSPGSIRLLVLQPSASHGAELRGSLLHMTLIEAAYDLIDPYTALSYVWGSEERPCLIFLDGKEFAITQSLNDALRDMRDATRARKIWADALCINQSDILERNNQVRLMGEIYGLASSTIIYLGHLTEDAAEVLAATTRRAAEVDYGMDDDTTGATDVAEVSNKHALVEAACRGILSRPWFKRVWVLQELVLSKSPWIQCGHQRVRWEDCCRFLLCNTTNPPNKHGALLSVLRNMNETRNVRAGGVGMSLSDVLKIRRGFGAADPRDRAYANFGIINDLQQVRRYLNVDYGVSLQVMLTKLAEYIISTKGARYLLTQVQDLRFEDYVEGLPSWIPQWQYSCPEMTNFGKTASNFPGSYQVLNIDGMPSILAHTGFDFDIVASVSAVLPIDRDAANALVATEKYLHCRKMLLEIYDSFVKTTEPVETLNDVVYDHLHNGHPLPMKEKESQHKSLCKSLGRKWVRFFETIDEQSNAESSADDDFSALFSRWVRREARKQRAFLNVRYTSGRNEKSICYGVPYLLQRYLESETDESLSGRRIAITHSGECALVPGQAREGDAIIALTDLVFNVRPWPLLIVRQKEEEGSQEIDARIMDAMHSHKPQPNERPTCQFLPEVWPVRTADCVEHYGVIGQGYVDRLVDQTSYPQEEQMHVFALH